MTRFDVTAIGEGGIRLSVPAGSRLECARTFDVEISGTEANVLCSLSSLGWSTGWLSAVPDSPLGRRVEATYRSYGVDLSGVKRVRDSRLGTYFVEYGTAPRPTRVYFDRANTAFANMSVADIDWKRLLDTRIVHLTGITAALSSSIKEILSETMSRAQRAGVPISFDVNYRSNLWSPAEAAEVLKPFLGGAEILFCPRQDAELLYDIKGSPEECIRSLQRMTNARHVIVTCGRDGFAGSLDGAIVNRAALPVEIVDRLGAGDGLAAGFLHGWLCNDVGRGVDAAVAMAALALSQWGEQIVTTVSELESIIEDPASDLQR